MRTLFSAHQTAKRALRSRQLVLLTVCAAICLAGIALAVARAREQAALEDDLRQTAALVRDPRARGRELVLARKHSAAHPRSAEAHRRLGRILSLMRRNVEAEGELRKAISLSPQDGQSHYYLAVTLKHLARNEDAVAEYLVAMQLGPRDSRPRVGLATLHYRQGRLGQALTLYQEAVALDRGELPETYLMLARTLTGLGKPDDAISALRHGMGVWPHSGLLHHELGLIHAQQKGFPEAVEEFRAALVAEPTYAPVRPALARALLDCGDLPGAEQEYRRAIAAHPRSEPAWLGLGESLRLQERVPEALAAYREAVRIAPENGLAQASVGWVLLKQRKWTEAAAATERGLRLSPGMGWAHSNLAAAYYEQGLYAEAWREVHLAGKDASAELVKALRAKMPEPKE